MDLNASLRHMFTVLGVCNSKSDCYSCLRCNCATRSTIVNLPPFGKQSILMLLLYFATAMFLHSSNHETGLITLFQLGILLIHGQMNSDWVYVLVSFLLEIFNDYWSCV